MPTLDVLIPEVSKQVVETVSECVVARLLNILKIDMLFKNSLYIVHDDLKPSNFETQDHERRKTENRCDVEVIAGYNPLDTAFDTVRSRSIDVHSYSRRWMGGEYPVFKDPRSGIDLYEVPVPCSVEMKFSIKVKNSELSNNINASLFSRYLTGGSIYDYSDIQFTYPIPDTLISLMFHMYEMQADVKAKMSFHEYLKIGSNTAITYLVNRDRKTDAKELVIQRTNTRVLGKCDYSGEIPTIQDINKIPDRYVTEFSYFFQFSKPSMLRISYPVMICNAQIDKQYVGTPNNMSTGQAKQVYPDIAINTFLLKQNTNKIDLNRSYPMVRYPYYDDWQRSPRMYKEIHSKYQILFIGLLSITVDPTTNAKSLTVDLVNEIFPMIPHAGMEIAKVILMLNLADDASQTRGDMFRRLGIFDIAVFCNDAIVPFDNLHLSDHLVLTVSGDLDITKLYRVVISQIRDIKILNSLYIYYMLENPEYYQDFLAANMTYLVTNNYVRIVTNVVTKENTAEMVHVGMAKTLNNMSRPSIIINNYVVEVCRNR